MCAVLLWQLSTNIITVMILEEKYRRLVVGDTAGVISTFSIATGVRTKSIHAHTSEISGLLHCIQV
jgi:hypothetical protein